ncbi:hypothetical protein [Nitratireductor sp. ZSWI3]|uniref:hypothetical protein n=1 Tax=Nitratireductor sp. ZSWI3 TaxID=2966359 RepID=UPI00214FDB2C|nr:hypothetical protein [Nitratireductor sp. ZSWI3]MCR4268977.1 hypothetical protein [Nitratireductor sp. ZSWI3]
MSDVLSREYCGGEAPWRLLPSWNLNWRGGGRRRRLDPRDVPEDLLQDIGLSDMRRLRPKSIRD